MSTKKVLAVVEDLFFTVKINESAKRAGVQVAFVKSQRDALDQAPSRVPNHPRPEFRKPSIQ